MNTATRKAKGRRFQQWVRDQIIDIIGIERDCVTSTSMGVSGSDVVVRGLTNHFYFPYEVECKNVEKIALWETIRQAKSHTKESGQPWAVFIKKNNTDPVVVVDAVHFFNLLADLKLYDTMMGPEAD